MSRLAFDIDSKFNQTLTDLENSTGGTRADVIRKAVATYKYLIDETAQGNAGNRISIRDAGGNVKKDVILP